MRRANGKGLWVIVAVFIAVAFSSSVYAQPTGVDQVDRGLSERGPTTTPIAVQAQAGNVTGLTINATRLTNRWQGYYGNITGTITLGDGAGNLLYNWDIASPQGEIYAVNSSVVPDWDNVFCFNFSNNKSDGQPVIQSFNGTDLEGSLNMGDTDVDGVDETFNDTFTGSFSVGSVTIDSTSGCSLTHLYVNSEAQHVDFEEVLLTDNQSIIYTALLEQDATGFAGTTVDFQLIVGENGDNADPTDYYFYVELT